MVGVMNEKLVVLSSVLPDTAFALESIVTSNFVANGKGVFGSGVKISVVVPDHRNVPFTGGSMRNHGAATLLGIFPTTTIGSLKTTRISFASASVASSPTGPALMMVSLLAAWAERAANRRKAAEMRFMARILLENG